MDEVEGWWITANVRRVPMSACRVEDRFFNLCGELCTMENEMKLRSQLDKTKGPEAKTGQLVSVDCKVQ